MSDTTSRRPAAPKKDESTGLWGFVVDVGDHPAQRCTSCNRRVWLQGARRVDRCSACGEPMGPIANERRQARRRGFRTRKEAQNELDRLRVSVTADAFVAPATMTVGEYLEAWMAGLPTQGLRPTTLRSYRENLRLHVIPRIGSGRLTKLTAVDLDRLYADLLDDGRSDGKGGLSPRTVRYIAMIVKRSFGDAVRKQILQRNVADAATPPSAKSVQGAEMATWTPAELAGFLTATAGDELGPMWRLGSMTGMRRGELCGLRWRDVDLEACRVTVSQQVVNVGSAVQLGEVKTDAGRRTISIDAKTVVVLRAHKVAQAKGRLRVGAGYTDHGLVFAGPHGAPLDPNRVTKAFRLAASALKVPRIRLHDLRHTHAAHAIAAGTHALVLSKRLGHANVAFTLGCYGHLLPNLGEQAAEAVAALVDA